MEKVYKTMRNAGVINIVIGVLRDYYRRSGRGRFGDYQRSLSAEAQIGNYILEPV